MKRKLARLPVPDDVKRQLSEASRSQIERVRLAEKCRADFGQSRDTVIELCGVPNTDYSRICHLLQPANKHLLEMVERGQLSIYKADRAIKNPSVLYQSYPKPLLDALKGRDAEIVFSANTFCVYELDDQLFVNAASYKNIATDFAHRPLKKYSEKCYLFDNKPFVRQILIDLIGRKALRRDMRVKDESGNLAGDVRHYILAKFLNLPAGFVLQFPIRQMEAREDFLPIDYRFANIRCDKLSDLIPGAGWQSWIDVVDRNKIYVSKGGVVTIADYSPELLKILKTFPSHQESRGAGRLVVRVAGQSEYLYHMVLAANTYGALPVDSAGICEMMSRYRREHKGAEVDHLNGVSSDCRLRNLMLVSPAQNQRKEALQRRLVTLGQGFFANAVRLDDSHVQFVTGRYDPGGAPEILTSETLDIEGYLEAFECFLDKLDAGQQSA